MTNEWFEVHSDDDATDQHFRVELEGTDEYAFYGSIEEAREAGRVARECHPTTRIWIVRVAEEEVEDVPVSVPASG
jgi:hypothetical protein